MMILNISAQPYEPSLKTKPKSIYLTAGSSFLARNILEQLDYGFTATTHDQLDLTDHMAVTSFFKDKYFDYIIHTACVGGRRNGVDDMSVFDANIDMFMGLLANRTHFGRLINFGSGADQFNTWYGKAKRLIANIISGDDGMVNLRLFGVWGKYEKPDRFPAYCLSHSKVMIDEDKRMRYIHVDDLVKIVDRLIQQWDSREMILGKPILLSKLAKQLNPNIKVIVKGKGEDYV